MFFCILFLIAGLIHCGEGLSTTNPVQPIDLAELDKKLSHRDFNGMFVIMASWCPPCRKELPVLEKLYQKYHKKGFQVIALSIDETGPKKVQPLINKLRVSFPVYWAGPKGGVHYKVSGIPTMIIYNQGKPIKKIPGSRPESILERIILELVAVPDKKLIKPVT